MSTLTRSTLLLVAACCVGAPGDLRAHGSPARWAAESTDMGCWITRWLGRAADDGSGEQMVGLQVVFGRIHPPRKDLAQAALTQAELDGATTLNVRVVDPSLKDAESITVVRSGYNPVDLKQRQLEGELGEFPSFYLTGATVDSILKSLRDGKVSAIVARRSDGSEVRFANSDTGMQVGFAMYDACVESKPAK